MKSNTKEVKNQVRAYILECIDLSGYELENTASNVFKVFASEFECPYNAKMYPTRQERFIEWALGAPSSLNFTLDYEEVREILINRFKTNTPKKRDDTKSLRYFLGLIYMELVAMDQEPAKQSERLLKQISKSFGVKEFTYKTIAQVRAAFWAAYPEYKPEYRKALRQNQYRTDIRCSFVEFIDHLERNNEISEELAQRVTL